MQDTWSPNESFFCDPTILMDPMSLLFSEVGQDIMTEGVPGQVGCRDETDVSSTLTIETQELTPTSAADDEDAMHSPTGCQRRGRFLIWPVAAIATPKFPVA